MWLIPSHANFFILPSLKDTSFTYNKVKKEVYISY